MIKFKVRDRILRNLDSEWRVFGEVCVKTFENKLK